MSRFSVRITICSLDGAAGAPYTESMEENRDANRIQIGQTVYLVVSCVRIREAVVRCRAYGLYTVQFIGTGGAIRVPGGRLYASREEAEQHLRKNQREPEPPPRPGYWHNVPLWMS